MENLYFCPLSYNDTTINMKKIQGLPPIFTISMWFCFAIIVIVVFLYTLLREHWTLAMAITNTITAIAILVFCYFYFMPKLEQWTIRIEKDLPHNIPIYEKWAIVALPFLRKWIPERELVASQLNLTDNESLLEQSTSSISNPTDDENIKKITTPCVLEENSTKKKDKKTSRKPTKNHNNPLNCKIEEKYFPLLAKYAIEAEIFSNLITPKIMEDFFYCRKEIRFESTYNRGIGFLMGKLAEAGLIKRNWQKELEDQKLVFAPEKGGYLNAGDLKQAKFESFGNFSKEENDKIDKIINQIKENT